MAFNRDQVAKLLVACDVGPLQGMVDELDSTQQFLRKSNRTSAARSRAPTSTIAYRAVLFPSSPMTSRLKSTTPTPRSSGPMHSLELCRQILQRAWELATPLIARANRSGTLCRRSMARSTLYAPICGMNREFDRGLLNVALPDTVDPRAPQAGR